MLKEECKHSRHVFLSLPACKQHSNESARQGMLLPKLQSLHKGTVMMCSVWHVVLKLDQCVHMSWVGKLPVVQSWLGIGEWATST